MASLGDLVIKVGGDVSGFRNSMQDASSAADQFTSKITAQLSEGVTLFDAYGKSVQTAVAPTEKLVQANVNLAAAADRVVASLGGVANATEHVGEASAHAVTEVQAVSGAIRTFDGNGGIRAAERFIANVLNFGRAFQVIFPAVGLIALGEMVAGVAEKAYRAAQNFFFLRDAEEAATEMGKKLATEAEHSLDHIIEMQIQALKNQGKLVEAAKLEQGRVLNKPIEMPEIDKKKFSELDTHQNAKDFETLNNLLARTTASQLSERIKQITDEVTRLKGELKSIENAGFDPTFLNTHYGSQIRTELQLYDQALEFFKTKQQEAAQEVGTVGSGIPKARQEEADKALEAIRKQSEALKAADEDSLATLKANHEATIGETISFWQKRLAAESSNAQRAHEISITLGNLYQEQDKMLARVAEHGAKLMEEQAHRAEEWASKMEGLAVDAQKLIDTSQRQVEERQTRLTKIGIQSEAQGQEGAAGFRKLDAEKEFAGLVFQTESARIALLQREAAIEQQISEAKLEALSKEQQDEEDPVKKAELGLQLQRAIIEAGKQREQTEIRITEEKRRQSLADQLASSAMRIPGAVGNSLAAGIMSGKNIGQDIANSLKGIGQQMLGNVFNRLISTMLQNIAVHIGLTAATSASTAATSAHTAVTFSHMGVMAAHMGAVVLNTIATVANTLWTAILAAVETVKSFFGFADGGSPPVGVPSIVGERGPELFIPKQAGVIIPNHQLNFRPSGQAASMSSSQTVNSGGNTFHFHGVQNVRDMMRQIASVAKTASPQFSPAASR